MIGSAGTVVGGAFLVTPDLVLTAAHVINLATGNSADGTVRPDAEVSLNFVVASDQFVRAEVMYWLPPGDATPEDIAGLRLIDPLPDGVKPAPLIDLRAPAGRSVMMLGFPKDAPSGGWGHGLLADADARDLVQVDTTPDSQFTIEAGFSGTPVWDVADRAAAGLVVEGWTRGRRSGFMIPTSVLLAAWPELTRQVWPASPFLGLKSFTEHDSGVFYGRDELVSRIVKVTEQAPALTLIGPSGAGKSSLLHAGVLPRLRDRDGLVVATIRPSHAKTPLRAVALALATVADSASDPLKRGSLVDDFSDRLAQGQVSEVVGAVLARCDGERLLLVVDQFEEALIAPLDELTQLVDVLRHCLDPGSRLTLLAALRADFLGRALQHRRLAGLVEAPRLVTIGELNESELRSAIVEPVRGTRLVRYEAGLVERLLNDVGVAPGRLPLVQFTLAMLWEAQESGELTHRAYDALGGIDSALAGHAEAVWSGLGAAERAAAARLVVQLLYPVSDSTSFVRRVAPRGQLDDAQWGAAQRLAADRARLVVVRKRDGNEVAELAHDALVTHWQRLAELGEQDREFREWQEGLRQRIRRNGAPLAGADLREALRWQADRRADFAPAENSYVDKSRRNRFLRRRRLLVGVGVLVGIGVLVANQITSNVAADAANTLIRDAPASYDDGYAHLRTTLRAYRTSDTENSTNAIDDEYQQFARLDRVLPDYTALPIPVGNGAKPSPAEAPEAAAQKVSADGRTMVTTDPENNVMIWRIDGNTVAGHSLSQNAERVTISRDGRYVAYLQNRVPFVSLHGPPASSCTGVQAFSDCLDVYDTATGRTRSLGTVDSSALAEIPVLRFDPTSQVLGVLYGPSASATLSQAVTTWDVRSGKQRDSTTITGGQIVNAYDLWLAPGGDSAMLSAEVAIRPGASLSYQRVLAVKLTGPSMPFTELTGGPGVDEVAVSGDGERVAALLPTNSTGPVQDKLIVWEVATGGAVAQSPVLSSKQSIGNIGLDLHGDRVLVTGSIDELTWVWSVRDLSAPPATMHTSQWNEVLPIGSGQNSSLMLVDGDVIGLALPTSGEQPPMQRLTVAPPSAGDNQHADQYCTDMIAMLTSSVPAPNEVTDLPAGSYTGPLGD